MPASPAKGSSSTGPDLVQGPRASWRAEWLAVAAALVLAVVSGAYAVWLRGQVASLRGDLARADAHAVDLDHTLADTRREAMTLSRYIDVMGAPDAVRVDLKGQAETPASAGRAFWSPSRGLIFHAERLPVLPRGRVYQLWVVTATAPVSAGLLTVGNAGSASFFTALLTNVPKAVAIAVTIEPAGGAPAPTGPKVLIGIPSS